MGCWRYYQPQSLPAACQCRDWANWESPAAGSAPGDGVPREPRGVTPRGKGRIQVQAAWQPFIPSCWGGGAVGHRVGWGGEDERHCRKIHIHNLVRPPQKNVSQLGFIRESFQGVITWKADPSQHSNTFVLAGARCAPGKAG